MTVLQWVGWKVVLLWIQEGYACYGCSEDWASYSSQKIDWKYHVFSLIFQRSSSDGISFNLLPWKQWVKLKISSRNIRGYHCTLCNVYRITTAVFDSPAELKMWWLAWSTKKLYCWKFSLIFPITSILNQKLSTVLISESWYFSALPLICPIDPDSSVSNINKSYSHSDDQLVWWSGALHEHWLWSLKQWQYLGQKSCHSHWLDPGN